MVQGMITGIRGLCNGIGPALFGFVFYVFHVDLEEGEGPTVDVPASSNHTAMEDPYGKVLKKRSTNSEANFTNNHNIRVVKNSKWQEADQLTIYKV